MAEGKTAASLIQTLASSTPESLEDDFKARQHAQSIARKLVEALGDPYQAATEIAFSVGVTLLDRQWREV